MGLNQRFDELYMEKEVVVTHERESKSGRTHVRLSTRLRASSPIPETLTDCASFLACTAC